MSRRILISAVVIAIATAAPAAAATKYSHQEYFEHYEGTATCLECHEDEAEAFFHSQHYQWKGATPDVVNSHGSEQGKLTMVNDFCTNLTSTLPHDLIRGSVVDIIKQGQGTHRNKFEVDVHTHETGLSSKIIAAQVVLALGASPCANIPAPFELAHNQFDLAANRCGRVIHSSDAKRLEVMQSDLRADDTLLVIGGGLSAAQAALLGAERGVASTILCSRRPLVTRYLRC